MNERQKRLKEVYDYVRQNCSIHTKAGFAETVKYGRTSMSAAMNGNDGYLTDNLFVKICAAFPDTFNIDYLLNGNGNLLIDNVKLVEAEHELHDVRTPISQSSSSQTLDQGSLINAALAAKDEAIKAKDEVIASLRETIEALRTENKLLKDRIAVLQKSDALHYKFPMGVADEKEDLTKHV